MDQIKIWKFIAECRKKNNLTQMQLAEKLNITDRAISKWENGKALPDSSIMLDLCNEQLITILGICIVFLIPCFFALKLEVSVGVYKCKNCGYEIVKQK